MKEDLLHRIWQFQMFHKKPLYTEVGDRIEVIEVGQYLRLAGPDFFNAKISIAGQLWAGNVEIHIKASDWYAHQHQHDKRYENVVLHVVWESDVPVLRKDGSSIAVLKLKDYVDPDLLNRYEFLFKDRKWIYCEGLFPEIPFIKELSWKERLYVERLETKTEVIVERAREFKYNWNHIFFIGLAGGFGLHVNRDAFEEWASRLPYTLLEEYQDNLHVLEALFLGGAGLLEREIEDFYGIMLQRDWSYLKAQHQLFQLGDCSVNFLGARPASFPTLRLSQLACLYYEKGDVLQAVLNARTLADFYMIFDVGCSSYWESHFVFDKESKRKKHVLTKGFVDLLMMNVLIPFLYVYYKRNGVDFTEELFYILRELKPEQNQIITNFKKNGFKVSDALDTQSLLQLKKQYCNEQKCLDCLVGQSLIYKVDF